MFVKNKELVASFLLLNLFFRTLRRTQFWATPHPIWATPHPIWATPHPIRDTPYPIWATPHPTWAAPHPTWAAPHPLWATPHPLWATPYTLSNATPSKCSSSVQVQEDGGRPGHEGGGLPGEVPAPEVQGQQPCPQQASLNFHERQLNFLLCNLLFQRCGSISALPAVPSPSVL